MGRLESSGQAPWKKVCLWAHNGTASPSNDLPSLLMPSWPLEPKQHGIPINTLQRKRSGQDIQLKKWKRSTVPFAKWKAITGLLKIGSKQRKGGQYWQNSIFSTNALVKVQFAAKSTELSPLVLQSNTLFGISMATQDASTEKNLQKQGRQSMKCQWGWGDEYELPRQL